MTGPGHRLFRQRGCKPSISKPPTTLADTGSPFLPPAGTLAVCLLTLCVSTAQCIGDGERWNQLLGVVPASLWHFSSIGTIGPGQVIPVWLTPFAYVFFHGGLWHVLPNMTALWIFDVLVEPVMGTRRFLLTYFLSGVVGALGMALVLPHSTKAIAGALVSDSRTDRRLCRTKVVKPRAPALREIPSAGVGSGSAPRCHCLARTPHGSSAS
jgi:hypothetical protein